MELSRQQLVDLEMAKIKNRLIQFLNWPYSGLVIIVVVTLIFHFVIIAHPADLIFDEQHYVKDARVILSGGGTERPEHPPLAKLFITWGMRLFGDGPWGWRFFSIIASEASLVVTYLISRRIHLSHGASFLVTLILALENLSFVQGHIAMLDVYYVTFGMTAVWLYLRGNWKLSAVAIALSTLCKLNGAFFAIAIGIHWLITGWKKPAQFFSSMLLAPLLFVALMPVLDYAIWGEWLNPITQIDNMLGLTGALTFTENYQTIASYPWEWVALPRAINYYYNPNYYGMISPTLWVSILPAMGYAIYRALKGDDRTVLPVAWFLAVYALWIPMILVTDRITYVFYFYGTVPAVAIALAMGLLALLHEAAKHEGWPRRLMQLAIPIYLFLHFVAFIVMVPVPLAISIPVCIALYFYALYYIITREVAEETNLSSLPALPQDG